MARWHARLLLASLVAAPQFAAPLAGQVLVSPSTVLLGDNERIATLSVRNVSGVPQEVTVGFRFGYPYSDSVGTITVRYGDSVAAVKHSMAGWVRAFPRQAVVPPGAEQLVRLIAQPPADLDDGAYWTRMIIASQPQNPPVGSPGEASSARVILRVEQISSVIYQRGRTVAGVTLGSVKTYTDSSGAHLLVALVRTGALPYLGTIGVRVRDEAGNLVHEGTVLVSVYFDGVYRLKLPAQAWRSSSHYTADVSVLHHRPDVSGDRMPVAPPVTGTLTYTPP